MSKSKWLYRFFIGGFVVLYLATALISFCHAMEFFTIGNVKWMAITLAAVFEVGQMVVLSSLLLSNNKKTIIPWILLVILTTVQVIGNVFSVYKYISVSDNGYYVYLQKSLIDWWLSGVSQETIVVIISWIIGALLPIIALFMTSMVANNINLLSNEENASESKKDALNRVSDVEEQEENKEETKVEEKVLEVVDNSIKEKPVEMKTQAEQEPVKRKHQRRYEGINSADSLISMM